MGVEIRTTKGGGNEPEKKKSLFSFLSYYYRNACLRAAIACNLPVAAPTQDVQDVQDV
jgi:hypothetical protein